MFYIVFELLRTVHISATRCPVEMEFLSKCSILNEQVSFIEKSKLNMADMWLIPLDRGMYCTLCQILFNPFLDPSYTYTFAVFFFFSLHQLTLILL